MVITDSHATLEEAIAVFTEQSKLILKEYNHHRYFSPAPNRKHHKKQKSRSYAKNVRAHNRSHSQRAK